MAFNSNNVVKGDYLMLFTGSQKKPIAMATSHTLSKTLATNEINTKDGGSVTVVSPGKLSWEISTENLYTDTAFSNLNSYLTTGSTLTAYFGHRTLNTAYEISGVNGTSENWSLNTTSYYSYGQVLVTSLSINAASGDNATMSATLTGCGPIYDVY